VASAQHLRRETPNGTGHKCLYIYALISLKDKKLYIGFTEDVKRRVDNHNSGKVPSTKLRRPFKLIYYESHTSKEDALRREDYFKTSKGRAMLSRILRTALLIIK